jgi:Mrp family chromosome partitioning ATPase
LSDSRRRRTVLETNSILVALRRRWWVVVALALLGVAVGALPAPKSAVSATTNWTASHTLLLSTTSSTQTIYSDPVAFNQLQLFAVTGEVPKRAAAKLGFGGEPAALAAQVQVQVDQQTGALRISTTQSTAERAVLVADTFADELVSYLSERQDSLRAQRLTSTLAEVDSLETELKTLESQVAAAPNDAILSSRLDALSREYSVLYEQYRGLQQDQGQLQLTTLERAQAIAVTDRGLSAPRSRSSRGALGGLVGLALGIGAALLLARTDRRIRSHAQAEAIVGLRSQVAIPATKERVDGVVVRPERHEPLSDSYRTLRSVVGFVENGEAQAAGRVPVVLVVSGSSGDGKTAVASNLAAAFVESGTRAVAVNTDFRRPALSERILGKKVDAMAFSPEELATIPIKLLLTRSPINGLVVFDLSSNQGSPGELARVTAARVPEFASVAAEVVVVDTSPVGVTAEVLELVPLADVIVMIVRLDHTYIDAAQRTVDTVRALSKAHLLLVVVGEKVDRADYYEYAGQLDSRKGEPAKRKG